MITYGKANMVLPKRGVPLESLGLGTLVAVPVLPALQGRYGTEMLFRVAAAGHPGYPAGCVTLLTDRCVDSVYFDGAEATNPEYYRQLYGNNRYRFSNIARWLDSEAAAGQWYSPAHPHDAPPSAALSGGYADHYDTRAGFLAAFPAPFVAGLLPTGVTAALPYPDGEGMEVTTARAFLLSHTEVFGPEDWSPDEGTQLPVFTDSASRVSSLTGEARAAAENPMLQGSTVSWALRSAYPYEADLVRTVYDTGVPGSDSANGSTGVRVACNLAGTVTVGNADEAGVYRVAL